MAALYPETLYIWSTHVLKPELLGRWDVAEPGLTWERLMQNKNKELDRLNGVYMKLLNNAGVKYIEGRGKLVDAHTVEVNGKHYTVSLLQSLARWLCAQGKALPDQRFSHCGPTKLLISSMCVCHRCCIFSPSAVLYMLLGLLGNCTNSLG